MSEIGDASADKTNTQGVVEEDKTYRKDLLGGNQGVKEESRRYWE